MAFKCGRLSFYIKIEYAYLGTKLYVEHSTCNTHMDVKTHIKSAT